VPAMVTHQCSAGMSRESGAVATVGELRRPAAVCGCSDPPQWASLPWPRDPPRRGDRGPSALSTVFGGGHADVGPRAAGRGHRSTTIATMIASTMRRSRRKGLPPSLSAGGWPEHRVGAAAVGGTHESEKQQEQAGHRRAQVDGCGGDGNRSAEDEELANDTRRCRPRIGSTTTSSTSSRMARSSDASASCESRRTSRSPHRAASPQRR
jgi:hypothetical protein